VRWYDDHGLLPSERTAGNQRRFFRLARTGSPARHPAVSRCLALCIAEVWRS
jgi:hypothetical protein